MNPKPRLSEHKHRADSLSHGTPLLDTRTTALPCFIPDICLSLLDLDTFSEMKGHFSIEWLSQSSQTLCSSASTHPSNSWDSPGRDGPSTSGTASESLPGFYSRWRPENTEVQEKRMEPAQPGNSLLCTSTQETDSNDSNIIQQHTHGKILL